MTQLRCRQGESVHVQALVDPGAFKCLNQIRSSYQGMTGKDASLSVIVRRAILCLSDHLAGLNSQRAIDAELSALLKVR